MPDLTKLLLRKVCGHGFDHEIIDDAAANYLPVARVYVDMVSSHDRGWDVCKLFARSPQLLAACQAALHWFVDPTVGDDATDVIAQLKAAIAAIEQDA